MKAKPFRLIVRTKTHCIEQLLDEAKPCLVGRDPSCDIRLEDELVSGRHARLILSSDAWLVEDLNSTNGTFLDGARLEKPTPVPPRSRLMIGSASLELQSVEEIPSATPAVRKVEAPPGPLADLTAEGGNYQVVREIARGGMGEVHYAEDRNLKRVSPVLLDYVSKCRSLQWKSPARRSILESL